MRHRQSGTSRTAAADNALASQPAAQERKEFPISRRTGGRPIDALEDIAMSLRMVCIGEDGAVRIAANGPLTSEDFPPDADNLLARLLGEGWSKHRVLLDLSAADFIDSTAVGWLIDCHREMDADGGLLALHSVCGKVMRILKTLKIDRILPLLEDETAAQAAVAQAILIKDAA